MLMIYFQQFDNNGTSIMMNINVHFEECNIVRNWVSERYYAIHTICQNGLSTDYVPTIPRCIIAPKVSTFFTRL